MIEVASVDTTSYAFRVFVYGDEGAFMTVADCSRPNGQLESAMWSTAVGYVVNCSRLIGRLQLAMLGLRV